MLIKIKQACWAALIVLSSMTLAGCKGEDKALNNPATDSSKNTDTVNNSKPNPDEYLVTELDIHGKIDPQQIKVDSERGVIFVPQGGLLGEDDLPVLLEIDLATGLYRNAYGIVSRGPSKLVAPSETGHALASVLQWDDGSGEIVIQTVDGLTYYTFNVEHPIKELKFNEQYVFTLNDVRNQIHQYNTTTGEHIGSINVANIDDWLIANNSKTLIVLSNNTVNVFDFSAGPATLKQRATELVNATSLFGWLSPDETRLYQHDGQVLSVPSFQRISPITSTLSSSRRTLIDLAFVPDSEKHYTIENYSGLDGDVFLSPLANYEAEPQEIMGRRIFVTSAGVHLYTYENGKHKLYILKPNTEGEYKEGAISIAPRWLRLALDASRYTAREVMYTFELYNNAWSDLVLRFDVVNMDDYYHSKQIIIEPVCFNTDCASGNYSMDIPLERQPMHFSVRLADWFNVRDIRGLIGFRIRTPEKSWDKFTLQNIALTNIHSAGCNDIIDPAVLVFCDQ